MPFKTQGAAMHRPVRQSKKSGVFLKEGLERVPGIEPGYSAWKAAALPLSYTRIGRQIPHRTRRCQGGAKGCPPDVVPARPTLSRDGSPPASEAEVEAGFDDVPRGAGTHDLSLIHI